MEKASHNVSTLKVKVVLASTRQNRFSEIAGAWVMEQLALHEGIEAELLDLRDFAMPFFEEPESPSSKREAYTHPAVVAWTAKVAEADAFIVVTPEYNHGYPAVLKNALDYAYQEWNNKPVAFISYGSAMGARSVEQLRQVAIELQMAPIRNALHMPWDTVVAGRKEGAAAFAQYAEKLKGLLQQLTWWARTLRAGRNAA